MNTELEKTVDSVLANGELTDRSRELLMKKAEQLGVDLIDFELELESKIAQKKAFINNQQQNVVAQPKSNKEGDLKKCPSCGAPAESFSTKCSECGLEFRDIQAEKSISDLFIALEKIQNTRNEQGNAMDKLMNGNEANVSSRQVSTITSFPVPNSKEAILEFLAQAFPKAHSGSKWSFFNENQFERKIRSAWKQKCTEIIIKARFSMKDDKKTLEEIEVYAKQLGIK